MSWLQKRIPFLINLWMRKANNVKCWKFAMSRWTKNAHISLSSIVGLLPIFPLLFTLNSLSPSLSFLLSLFPDPSLLPSLPFSLHSLSQNVIICIILCLLLPPLLLQRNCSCNFHVIAYVLKMIKMIFT